MSKECKDYKNIPAIEKKEFGQFTVEAFSSGKTPKTNDDRWVVTSQEIAVIDGSTSNTQMNFRGLSSGAFASHTIAEIIKNTDPRIYGKELIDIITKKFNHELIQLGITVTKESAIVRPTAVMTAVSIIDDQICITQLGDVSFRINNLALFENPAKLNEINTIRRVNAIKKAQKHNPHLSMRELMEIAQKTVAALLFQTVPLCQNSPNHELGYGVIDGTPVPEKFINIFKFKKKDVSTLEVFSDGYFRVPKEPAIASWEQTFAEVEKEDPYKIGRYPSTKGSSADSFTDDRTILIAKFK